MPSFCRLLQATRLGCGGLGTRLDLTIIDHYYQLPLQLLWGQVGCNVKFIMA